MRCVPARHAIASPQLLDRHATLRALFYPPALFSNPRIDKTFLLSGIPSSSALNTRHPLVRVLVTTIAHRGETGRTVQRLGSPISLADSSAIDLRAVRSLAVPENLGVFGNICVKRGFQQAIERSRGKKLLNDGNRDWGATSGFVTETSQGQVVRRVDSRRNEMAQTCVAVRVTAAESIRRRDAVITNRASLAIVSFVIECDETIDVVLGRVEGNITDAHRALLEPRNQAGDIEPGTERHKGARHELGYRLGCFISGNGVSVCRFNFFVPSTLIITGDLRTLWTRAGVGGIVGPAQFQCRVRSSLFGGLRVVLERAFSLVSTPKGGRTELLISPKVFPWYP